MLDLEVERRKTQELARRLLARHEAAANRPAAPIADPDADAEADAAAADRAARSAPATPASPKTPSAPPAPPAVASRTISVPPPREPEDASPPLPAAMPGPRPPRADAARRPVLRPVDPPSAAPPSVLAAPEASASPDADVDADARVPEVLTFGDAAARSGRTHDRVARPASRVRDEELDAIRGLVGDVLRDSDRRRREPLSPLLFSRHLTLLGQELPEEAADAVCDAAREELSAAECEQPEAVDRCIVRHLAARIPIAAESLPARSPDGRPLTVAFVGPTGVGKTTTVAKLAAALRLRHGRSVGLITADTYRIAAVEQLRTYADIIGVPFRVASDPARMRAATLELSDCDVVLIDTAGRSQRDTDRINDLREFIDAADPHEVHMVLSGIAGRRALLREADAFGAVGVRKLVLTKLDEAVSYGMLIDAVGRIGVPLSFLTTGQEVPDDIERANAERFARLALDAESEPAAAAGDDAPRGTT
jgi:flagellar biosynthesis protein FlhF